MEKSNGFVLSKREEELMETLWTFNEPMTCNDMLHADWKRSWKDNYLSPMLQSLEKKGLLYVCGFELQGKRYARQFLPTFTKEEYIAKTIVSKIDNKQISRVLHAFIKETGTEFNNEQLAEVMVHMLNDDVKIIDNELVRKLREIIREIREI